MDEIYELDYLRSLNAKYSHYFKRYFGFTLSDIAAYIGISKGYFSAIMAGAASFPEAAIPRLQEAFKHFQVREKTEHFKESPGDRSRRELNASMRSDKKST